MKAISYRVRVRRSAALLLTAVMIATSCAADDGEVTAPTDAPDASAGERTGNGPLPETGGEPVPFEIRPEAFEALDAAGFVWEPLEYPSQPEGVPWPSEDWPTGELPEAVDAGAVAAVVDRAFDELSDDTGTIHAVLVVHGGELVVETYNGWEPDEPHGSWSVAKSITHALVGVLVGEQRLDVYDPAPVPEWSDPDDPRREVTLDQLLRMSSGLAWDENYVDIDGDVLSILVGEGRADRGAFAAAKPLDAEPDSTFYYSTGTSNLIARVVADEVGYGPEMTAWIDDVLFDPLGITSVEHDLDDAGVINAGSWINLTPRDFARFGLLYLRGGAWEGEQLLPEGWVDYARMPTPTAATPFYGAHWWLEEQPSATFVALGYEGQSITVVPDLDLVVVVLSDVPDGRDLAVRTDMVEAFAPVAG